MKEYKYMPLGEILKYESEMIVNNVSEVARSPSGFLTAYKKASGNPSRLSEDMRKKRNGFIARTLASYRLHKQSGHDVSRQRLALIAWAYLPD